MKFKLYNYDRSNKIIVLIKYPLSYRMLETSHNQQPRAITTDKYGTTEVAIILIYSDYISSKVTRRMVKYLNNIIEQDYRFIK